MSRYAVIFDDIGKVLSFHHAGFGVEFDFIEIPPVDIMLPGKSLQASDIAAEFEEFYCLKEPFRYFYPLW